MEHDLRVRSLTLGSGPWILALALLLISYDLGQMIESTGYLICNLRILV